VHSSDFKAVKIEELIKAETRIFSNLSIYEEEGLESQIDKNRLG